MELSQSSSSNVFSKFFSLRVLPKGYIIALQTYPYVAITRWASRKKSFEARKWCCRRSSDEIRPIEGPEFEEEDIEMHTDGSAPNICVSAEASRMRDNRLILLKFSKIENTIRRVGFIERPS
jgi:hypothetical protein